MATQGRVPPDLLTVRHKKGISIQEIAGSTKIRSYYLFAIEAGEYERLPGGIYNISYIRQYARAIDYDEDDLLGYYYRAAGINTEPEVPVQVKRHPALELLVRVLG